MSANKKPAQQSALTGPRMMESRYLAMLFSAALGAGASIMADRALRGDERAEQFAAVQEILIRVEKKVDENGSRFDRDLAAQRAFVTTLSDRFNNDISSNRTAIAVLKQRVDAFAQQQSFGAQDRGGSHAD